MNDEPSVTEATDSFAVNRSQRILSSQHFAVRAEALLSLIDSMVDPVVRCERNRFIYPLRNPQAGTVSLRPAMERRHDTGCPRRKCQ